MTTRTRARKELGQHWLSDSRVLGRIERAIDVELGETVVEIGPGKGALTTRLIPKSSRLVLVEVDPNLAAGLKERYAEHQNVTVIEGDVLELGVADLLSQGGGGLPYIVVGNLPYFIGSAIVRKFLTAKPAPRSLTVMLQAEVAERMAALPGKMGYLSVETQLIAEAKVLFRIPPRAFRPPPKVQSALLRLDVRDSPEVEVDDRKRFLDLVKAGFAAPRKQLRNSLAVGLKCDGVTAVAIISAAGLDPSLRPGNLDLEDWRDLYLSSRRAVDK